MCDGNCILAAIGNAARALSNELGTESDVDTIRRMDAIVLELGDKAEYYAASSAYDVLEHEPFIYDGPQDRCGYIAQAYDLAATRYWAEAYAPGCAPSEFFNS